MRHCWDWGIGLLREALCDLRTEVQKIQRNLIVQRSCTSSDNKDMCNTWGIDTEMQNDYISQIRYS